MSRNVKPGITFYRMDSGHIINKKVRLLYNEFDSDGYYIWKCLIDYAYQKWGYFFDINNKEDLEWFAAEYCRKKLTLIKEVITGCIRRGLFDKTVADAFGVLTSDMMQEVFVYATADRRSKGSVFEMQEDWMLIRFDDKVPVNLRIVPGKNSHSSAEVSTDKTKQKLRQDKTKQEVSAAASPPLPKKNEKEGEKEPYWHALVKIWFDFGIKKFRVQPSFERDDPKILMRIVHRLKNRAGMQKLEWTLETSQVRLQSYLDGAFADDWLSKNFLLSNLEKQFDKVIQDQANRKKPAPADPAKATLDKMAKEINYLYERFLEGGITIISVDTRHFDFLNGHQLLIFNADDIALIRGRAIDHIAAKDLPADRERIEKFIKLFGILEFFQKQKSANVKIIFDVHKKAAAEIAG